jgi:5'-3' exonuclease
VLQNIAEPWDNMSPRQRMAHQRDKYYKPRDESNKAAIKKTYNPGG